MLMEEIVLLAASVLITCVLVWFGGNRHLGRRFSNPSTATSDLNERNSNNLSHAWQEEHKATDTSNYREQRRTR